MHKGVKDICPNRLNSPPHFHQTLLQVSAFHISALHRHTADSLHCAQLSFRKAILRRQRRDVRRMCCRHGWLRKLPKCCRRVSSRQKDLLDSFGSNFNKITSDCHEFLRSALGQDAF
eukprot:s581_g22.t1